MSAEPVDNTTAVNDSSFACTDFGPNFTSDVQCCPSTAEKKLENLPRHTSSSSSNKQSHSQLKDFGSKFSVLRAGLQLLELLETRQIPTPSIKSNVNTKLEKESRENSQIILSGQLKRAQRSLRGLWRTATIEIRHGCLRYTDGNQVYEKFVVYALFLTAFFVRSQWKVQILSRDSVIARAIDIAELISRKNQSQSSTNPIQKSSSARNRSQKFLLPHDVATPKHVSSDNANDSYKEVEEDLNDWADEEADQDGNDDDLAVTGQTELANSPVDNTDTAFSPQIDTARRYMSIEAENSSLYDNIIKHNGKPSARCLFEMMDCETGCSTVWLARTPSERDLWIRSISNASFGSSGDFASVSPDLTYLSSVLDPGSGNYNFDSSPMSATQPYSQAGSTPVTRSGRNDSSDENRAEDDSVVVVVDGTYFRDSKKGSQRGIGATPVKSANYFFSNRQASHTDAFQAIKFAISKVMDKKQYLEAITLTRLMISAISGNKTRPELIIPVEWAKSLRQSSSSNVTGLTMRQLMMKMMSPANGDRVDIHSLPSKRNDEGLTQMWKDWSRETVIINGVTYLGSAASEDQDTDEYVDEDHCGVEAVVCGFYDQILACIGKLASNVTSSGFGLGSDGRPLAKGGKEFANSDCDLLNCLKFLLMSSNRTRSGGDTYVCLQSLLVKATNLDDKQLVILCPDTEKANSMEIAIDVVSNDCEDIDFEEFDSGDESWMDQEEVEEPASAKRSVDVANSSIDVPVFPRHRTVSVSNPMMQDDSLLSSSQDVSTQTCQDHPHCVVMNPLQFPAQYEAGQTPPRVFVQLYEDSEISSSSSDPLLLTRMPSITTTSSGSPTSSVPILSCRSAPPALDDVVVFNNPIADALMSDEDNSDSRSSNGNQVSASSSFSDRMSDLIKKGRLGSDNDNKSPLKNVQSNSFSKRKVTVGDGDSLARAYEAGDDYDAGRDAERMRFWKSRPKSQSSADVHATRGKKQGKKNRLGATSIDDAEPHSRQFVKSLTVQPPATSTSTSKPYSAHDKSPHPVFGSEDRPGCDSCIRIRLKVPSSYRICDADPTSETADNWW